MKQLRTRRLCYCALFAALTGVCAQLSIAIGPVPISMASLIVMLSGLLLGWQGGVISMGCYLLLGLCGAPVFSALRGGAGVLLEPTGGYIIGYLPCALIAGLGFWDGGLWQRCLRLVAATLALYALGTCWFMIQSGNSLGASMSLCVLPFLPGDAIKILLCSWLTPRLKKALKL